MNNPWYKEFWAWFILTPLIVVVIVSSITVTIAVRNADDRVVDDYYKQGRMINVRMDEILRAKNLGINAELTFDQTIGELSVNLSQIDGSLPEQIGLQLSHPAKADKDQQLLLTKVAKSLYHTELPPMPLENRWYIRLTSNYSNPTIDNWRLRGEIDFAKASSITLVSE